MKVLLTGGAGYIGSHTAVELIAAGHEVVILDNFANSSPEAIRRVSQITQSEIVWYEADLEIPAQCQKTFAEHEFDAVIHFAGLKAVGESVGKPLTYYRTNLNATMNLIEMMQASDVKRLVFSSSATVYGVPASVPIDETAPVIDASNPYGRTKLMLERILEDICRADPAFNVVRLRYFNPAGAHESGEIGEDPSDIPNNLMPFVTQVAVGKREKLVVFGNDYPTPDGTCIRDYIHVVDLARGHVAALARLQDNPGLVTYNLGTGTGYSVLDIIKAFETANDLTINWEFGPRREGDIPESYTKPDLALRELGWQAEKGIAEICRDAFHWQQQNPNGFR